MINNGQTLIDLRLIIHQIRLLSIDIKGLQYRMPHGPNRKAVNLANYGLMDAIKQWEDIDTGPPTYGIT